MIVRCLLMQRDEVELLPLWIRYHGALFGYENLFVWDNGSGAKTHDILRSAEQDLGVNVDYSKAAHEDFEGKGTMFGEIISHWGLNQLADFYFPLDCDEFVAVRIRDGYSCNREPVHSHLRLIKQYEDAVFQVADRLDNSWQSETLFHKVPRSRKLFFGNSKVVGLDVGFHNCEQPSHVILSKVVYFHFHNRPFDQLRQASKAKLQLRLNNPGDNNTPELTRYNGPGYHLIRSITSSWQEYSDWLRAHPCVETTAPRNRFAELGFETPWV